MSFAKIGVQLELEKKVAAFRQKFQQEHLEAAKLVFPDLLQFLADVGSEGERSAVVLGAERINVAMEALLKAFLHPSPTKGDSLFSSEGTLGTFGRKTEMAYRLGLIDLGFKQAVDLVRKLRNDFAHATRVETLEKQPHQDRVKALSALMKKGNKETLEGFQLAFQHGASASVHSQVYLSCIMLLLVKLELVRPHLKPVEVRLPAMLDYQDDDAT